ncbi:hypothetical protein MLD38_031781 [Melastoma candidum]|uniref:Uncharacterized protein n=1 Tax=Melastoma candidum TaxID=119954 RepID=A0ACB9MQS1_9MYRT|nr:hypothetical protein MLD38_031781 [Melastoma candidum]
MTRFRGAAAAAAADAVLGLLASRRCATPSHFLQIQAQLILHCLQSHPFVASRFIDACDSLGLLNTAVLPLFTRLRRPHPFIFNTLIRAFSHSKSPHVSFSLYAHMHSSSISPNSYTFPFLLNSLADSRDLRSGACVHAHVVKLGHLGDVYVGNSLLHLYGSAADDMADCRRLFDEMPFRDVVSWTMLITGYRNVRSFDDALFAFEQMQYAGVEPNRVTLVNTLAACSGHGAVEMGLWVHDFVMRRGLELDVSLGTALIDMYSKCGRIDEGMRVFESMTERNVWSWNAVIKGLANAMRSDEAVKLFRDMVRRGIEVDDVTLLAVLSACSHSRLIEEGRELFDSLVNGKYRVSASLKHYACMVDLLARAGCLMDAYNLINSMPFEPTKTMWGALVVGCRAHKHLELGEFAAKRLVEMEPDNSAHYVVLSNVYSEMGRWNDAQQVRDLMKMRGLQKDLGYSSVGPELMEAYS